MMALSTNGELALIINQSTKKLKTQKNSFKRQSANFRPNYHSEITRNRTEFSSKTVEESQREGSQRLRWVKVILGSSQWFSTSRWENNLRLLFRCEAMSTPGAWMTKDSLELVLISLLTSLSKSRTSVQLRDISFNQSPRSHVVLNIV
mgnify:CR=1 FL=1